MNYLLVIVFLKCNKCSIEKYYFYNKKPVYKKIDVTITYSEVRFIKHIYIDYVWQKL